MNGYRVSIKVLCQKWIMVYTSVHSSIIHSIKNLYGKMTVLIWSKIILATFDEFYASLDPDVGIRGKQFEKFVKWFLKTDPTWASQIDEVWLWNDYPKRWGADCGIDLVFTHKNGKT